MHKYRLYGQTRVGDGYTLNTPIIDIEYNCETVTELLEELKKNDYWITTDAGEKAMLVVSIEKL